MELSAYLPKNGKYEKAFSRKWPYSSDLRGLYFIGMQRNRIRVNRIVEFSLPMETTLGFGLPSVSNMRPTTNLNHRVAVLGKLQLLDLARLFLHSIV